MQVEAVLTRSDASAMAGAIVSSYGRIVGHAPPSRSSWLVPLAQSALETKHWSAMWNYNAGNITSGQPDREDWLRIPVSGLTLDHGGAAGKLRFRASGSLGEGTDALVAWLDHHGAIAAADAGDFEGFVAALQNGGYVGSDPKVYGPYRDTLGKLVKELGATEPGDYQGGGSRRWAPAPGAGEVASRSGRGRGLGVALMFGLGLAGLSRIGRRGRA